MSTPPPQIPSPQTSREAGPTLEAGAEAMAQLQRYLLPASVPTVPGYEFAVYYRPCEAAGGDFYGFQPFADGRMGFVVADVAGHGAVAAVMMAALRSALAAFRVFGRLRESAPQDFNAIVNEIAVPGMFITAFFVSLDPAAQVFYCGNCGHPPAIIRRAGGAIEMVNGEGSVPLGILPEIAPPTIASVFHAGDALVLYTDGITEARSQGGTEFGLRGLIDALGPANDATAQGVCDAIVRALRQHEHGAAPQDDQCILVCKQLG